MFVKFPPYRFLGVVPSLISKNDKDLMNRKMQEF